jgi:hypothetical protein
LHEVLGEQELLEEELEEHFLGGHFGVHFGVHFFLEEHFLEDDEDEQEDEDEEEDEHEDEEEDDEQEDDEDDEEHFLGLHFFLHALVKTLRDFLGIGQRHELSEELSLQEEFEHVSQRITRIVSPLQTPNSLKDLLQCFWGIFIFLSLS